MQPRRPQSIQASKPKKHQLKQPRNNAKQLNQQYNKQNKSTREQQKQISN